METFCTLSQTTTAVFNAAVSGYDSVAYERIIDRDVDLFRREEERTNP